MPRTFPIVRMTLGFQTVEFRDDSIVSCKVVQEIHPIGIELPASSATIRIYTRDPRFSPFSDGEYYAELANNAVLDIYESVDGEEVYIGRFYLETWGNPSEYELEFTCRDAIGVLATIPFDGYFWGTNTTLGAAVATVLDPTGMAYEVDAEVAGRPMRGYIPKDIFVRGALQQILFAGGAYALTAKSERIVIKSGLLPLAGMNMPAAVLGEFVLGASFFPPEDGAEYNGVIGLEDKTDKQALKQDPLVTGIRLIAHDYAKGTVQEVIFSEWLEPGDHKIVYPKPYTDVIAEGVGATPAYLMTESPIPTAITTEDGKILGFEGAFEFGVNHIYLHVTEPGNVVVRGYPWIDSQQEFAYDEAEATKHYATGGTLGVDVLGDFILGRFWSTSAAPNVWSTENATMVSAEIAPAVLGRLIRYAKLRYRQTITLFPRLDVQPGNIELLDSLHGKDLNAIVKRMTSDLSGGYLMDAELVGVERKV